MILPYIINVALVLGACLSFYKILLRHETFYKVNRWLLMLCLAVSFALPLLQVPQEFSLRNKTNNHAIAEPQPAFQFTDGTKQKAPVTDIIPQQQPVITGETVTTNNAANTVTPSFSFAQLMNWVFVVYWFGVILFGAAFLFQVGILLYRMMRYPVIKDGHYRIVEVNGNKAPCSFGNTIFINPSQYDLETYQQILLHEKIHVRQKHTIDILIAELVLIFQWFNPFAWIYRREIENNLEFLTDDQLVQQQEVDKKSYQLSLVKVSAPHLPLKLTNNYNQSILKTRIAMMNKKRSNLHTAWKYFFLLPVLAFLACLLNEPLAKSQTTKINHEKQVTHHDIETEGSWFATIKGENISIQFKNDDDVNNNSFSGNTYKLSELSPAPKEGPVSFTITRDAGKIEFTGRFENNTGMGRYKFIADKAYGEQMNNDLKEKLDDRDLLVFFFINVKKGYIADLKSEGYTDIGKEELIPLAALGVDKAYIHSIKNAGYKDVSLEDLIPLKSLGVDDKYVAEIKSAGYKNITADQLVSFKAQGIDKEYISKVKQMKGKDLDEDDTEQIVSFKAMGIDEAFINSFKAIGLTDLSHEQLVSFKALDVTPAYIKSWQAAGFNNIDPEEFAGMKSQNVTPEFMKSFTDMGYKNVQPENLVSFRALGVTPEYIRSFEAAGYKNIDLDDLAGLKSQNVTPEFIKSFEVIGYKNIDLEEFTGVKALNVTPEFIKSLEVVGFKNIPLEDVIAAKASGVTVDYIKEMKAKGLNYNTLQKYITLKSID